MSVNPIARIDATDIILTIFVHDLITMIELPADFSHDPPKNLFYVVDEFKRNVIRICIVNHVTFPY